MALGPGTIGEKRAAAVDQAETLVDKAIAEADSLRVTVAANLLGITREEWDRDLRPKYLAGGWKLADWVSEQRDGDYLDLQA